MDSTEDDKPKNRWKTLKQEIAMAKKYIKENKDKKNIGPSPDQYGDLTYHLYNESLSLLFLKIKICKLRYFIFKPATRFLHLDLMMSILLNKSESGFAMLALLLESATIAFIAFYFGIHISLFVFIGFGALYTLIYSIRRIGAYIAWRMRGNSLKPYEKADENDELEEGEADESITLKLLREQENRSSYASRFMKKNYIAVIAYLFESAAIAFTALYFNLQISLFVFVGFSLFYTLIYATRKIISCCEPEILTYTELDDDSDSTSVDLNEEKIPLIENDLYKE